MQSVEVSKAKPEEGTGEVGRLLRCCVVSMTMLLASSNMEKNSSGSNTKGMLGGGIATGLINSMGSSQRSAYFKLLCCRAQNILRLTPFIVPKMVAAIPVIICGHTRIQNNSKAPKVPFGKGGEPFPEGPEPSPTHVS